VCCTSDAKWMANMVRRRSTVRRAGAASPGQFGVEPVQAILHHLAEDLALGGEWVKDAAHRHRAWRAISRSSCLMPWVSNIFRAASMTPQAGGFLLRLP